MIPLCSSSAFSTTEMYALRFLRTIMDHPSGNGSTATFGRSRPMPHVCISAFAPSSNVCATSCSENPDTLDRFPRKMMYELCWFQGPEPPISFISIPPFLSFELSLRRGSGVRSRMGVGRRCDARPSADGTRGRPVAPRFGRALSRLPALDLPRTCTDGGSRLSRRGFGGSTLPRRPPLGSAEFLRELISVVADVTDASSSSGPANVPSKDEVLRVWLRLKPSLRKLRFLECLMRRRPWMMLPIHRAPCPRSRQPRKSSSEQPLHNPLHRRRKWGR
mmetsp:Transcript_15393/g.31246  ORF Transcript_15393/g.31246 Transcript_15393/m.31246 type:complete len:276 (+) Transcript_15393:980-1807(+)